MNTNTNTNNKEGRKSSMELMHLGVYEMTFNIKMGKHQKGASQTMTAGAGVGQNAHRSRFAGSLANKTQVKGIVLGRDLPKQLFCYRPLESLKEIKRQF